MVRTTSIILPWPNKALHPNGRPHWAVKSRATKSARALAHYTVKSGKWDQQPIPADGVLRLNVRFYPPCKRRRDDDGLMSSVKAYRDGVADALGMDDNRFRGQGQFPMETRPGGEVEMWIAWGISDESDG